MLPPARYTLLTAILIGSLSSSLFAVESESSSADKLPAGVISSAFIDQPTPTPQCHASTIAETPDGLVAAWFGGTREKHPDVGIWVAQHREGKWQPPTEVANGAVSKTERYPTWNPVLFQMPEGPLLLFYKLGPSPSTWWGMLTTSDDHGKTWSKPTRLPDDIAGPIKNKPIHLKDGTLLCPSSTEDKGWRVHIEFTKDAGKTWSRTEALCDGKAVQAIQPTVLVHDDKLQMLCRTRKPGQILESWSDDLGKTWSDLTPIALVNPNSGIDGVTLASGQHLLVYNHTLVARSPLNLATSADGKSWDDLLVLETAPGEYSYPAIIQTSDGLVHITYTWKRLRVKHVVIDPAKMHPTAATENR